LIDPAARGTLHAQAELLYTMSRFSSCGSASMAISSDGTSRLQELAQDWELGLTSPILAQAIILEVTWKLENPDLLVALSLLPVELRRKFVAMSAEETNPEFRRIVDFFDLHSA
jgi:hypothetical protein